ncbi:MAG: histidinol-phosphatase [Pseudomonadota bacterium]
MSSNLHADDRTIAELTAFAGRLADASGPAILPHFRSGAAIENKLNDGFDPVTAADKAGERTIRVLIEETYPDHGILGEEYGTKDAGGPWRWVLDPVDGTRAFISGLPLWTTLIALDYEGAPALGLIDQPFTGERWSAAGDEARYARRGEPARKIACSRQRRLADAIVSTTDPRPEAYFSPAEADAFAAVARRARLARFGLDAYAYAMLAHGEIDLVIETGLQPYDFHAHVPIVRAAGGVITDWRGGAEPTGAQVVAAASPALLEEALAILEPAAL